MWIGDEIVARNENETVAWIGLKVPSPFFCNVYVIYVFQTSL